MPNLPAFAEKRATKNQVLVMALIKQVLTEHPAIDAERIYLTGLSSGGSACFSLAERHPFHFAGIVPVCGGYKRILEEFVTPQPIAAWAFVNRSDEQEVLRSCGLMLDHIKSWGGKVEYNTYTDQGVGGHSAWNWAYAEPKLLPWLFKMKRPKPPKPKNGAGQNGAGAASALLW